jgi:hypothetical protein
MPNIVGVKQFKYDPCIEGLDKRPEPADVVICTDVLEHVEPKCLENVLDDLRKLTKVICFVSVCLTPAMKKYPDGQNCHLSLMDYEYWYAKFRKRFLVTESNKVTNAQGHDKFVCVLQAKNVAPVVKKTDKFNEQLTADYAKICEPIIDVICSKCEDHCCNECAEKNGWFTNSFDRVNMYKLEFGFDPKYGFLDNETKACKIPRNYRSVRCQGWICGKVRDSLDPDIVERLEDTDAYVRYAREKEGLPI